MSELFEWREDGHKYQYSPGESLAMVIVTAVTNLACIPAVYLLYKKGLIFQTYIGLFTFITSFMYHFAESIGADKILMSELEWHQLDNIGAILCFIGVFIYMANFKDYLLESHLNYSATILVIMLQIASPWNLLFTVGPILGYGSLIVILALVRKTKPFTNREMTIKGALCILSGAVFFTLSQDEFQDYLRIYHGLWHLVIGYSAMYTWQTHEREGDHVYVADLLNKPVRSELITYDSSKDV